MAYLTNFLRLATNRLTAPAAKPTIYYGMNGIQPPYGVPAAQYFAQELVQLGLNCNRSAITWSSVAPSPGVYDWTQPDYTINALIAAGIRPVMQMIFTPSWAVPGGPWSARPFADMPNYITDPTGFTTWVNYHVTFNQAAATRYGATIDYEIWNEQFTQSGYWQEGGSTTQAPHIAGYAQLYVAVQNAIKAIAPTAKVCVGGVNFTDSYTGNGTAGIAGIQTLIPLLNSAGVTPDAVGMHPYPLGGVSADPFADLYPAVGKNSFQSIRRMQKMMIANGYGNVELWVTEDGYINNGVLLTDAFNGISEANKALWIAQRFQMIHLLYSSLAVGSGRAGVTRYLYYKLENYSNGTQDTDSTGVYTGTPIGGPHTQLLSGAAVQAFMQSIQPGNYVPWLNTLTLTAPTLGVIGDTIGSCTTTGLDQRGVAIGFTPTYRSSDSTVATVNASTGVVTLVGTGTCVLSAFAFNTRLTEVPSNRVTLTVQAQVATTVSVTPNPWLAAVSGGTVAFAATALDQLGNPMGAVPGTWSSSDVPHAPINSSTGVMTPGTAASGVVITFTVTAGGATGTSTGNISGAVSAVSIGYTGSFATDTMTRGMLLFTGSTYQLVPQDQYGNTLPTASGTWASTDATNFPVSAGLVSPAAGIGGGSVTFTHTASGQVGTVSVSVLKTPAALVAQGSISTLANTAALMAQISNTVTTDANYNSGLPVPTGIGSPLYTVGANANHLSITTSASNRFMGNGVMQSAIPSTSSATSQLQVPLSGTVQRYFGLSLIQFDTNFTMIGTGGGNATFKPGGDLLFPPSTTGRGGRSMINGTSNTGTGGHPGGGFSQVLFFTDGSSFAGGSGTVNYGAVTTEFYAGEVWCHMLLVESIGGNILSSRDGWFKIGAVPSLTSTQASGIVEGPVLGAASPVVTLPKPTFYQPTPVNYIQAPPSVQLNTYIPLWQIANGDTYGDPFGVLNDTSTPTLTGISGGTVAPGATAAVITLTGTNFTNNCQPIFSNAKIYPQSINRTGFPTQMVVTVAVDATATTGAGTVLINNQSSQTNSATQVVTVSSGSVTSVHLFYTGNNSTVETTGGMLLFAGTTYQMVAKDQSGNVLSGGSGTWASTDATNFPVNSSGLISPASGKGGGSVTFTHTASGQVGTVLISVLKTPGAVYQQDWGYNYANTAALMGNIWSNVGVDSSYNSGLPVPTGPSNSLYIDGLGANHASVDSTTVARQFMGNNAIVNTLPVTIGGHAVLRTTMGTPSFTRLFAITIHRYDPPFTLHGTNVSSQAYKIPPWVIVDNNGGRINFELSNGNGTSGKLSTDCITRGPSSAIGGGTSLNNGNLTTELTNGEWWVDCFVYENRAGNIMSARYCHFKIGDVPAMTYGPLATVNEGPMIGNPPAGPVPKGAAYSAVGENYNEDPPVATDYHVINGWMVVDGETYGDPFGILADATSPTLTGISGGTIVQGDLTDVITLTGTNFNLNCWPVFSNNGIYAQSINVSSSTTMLVTVAVDPTATTGAGTVLVHNGSSKTDSATQVVTVNSSGGGGVTIRQQSAPTGTTASTTSTLAGSTIIIPMALAAGNTVTSITDNVGNTYIQCASAYINNATPAGAALDIWYCKNATAGATTITPTVSGGAYGIWAIEGRGLSTTAPFQIANGVYSGTSSSTITGAAVTTTSAAELIVGIGINPGAYNPITGIAGGNAFSIGQIYATVIATATLITTSTGTYNPAWAATLPGTQLGSTAAFK